MKHGYRYRATIILGMAAVGFFASYPFSSTFLGKLLSSGFSAAMIGGLADWFGVTALTRKPLGIPFRTEIIPRNRKKLFDSLVHMVEDELLTKETLKKKLTESRISLKLITYLEEYGGKKDIETIITGVLQDILAMVDPGEVRIYIDRLMADALPGVRLAPVLVEALEWTMKNGYDKNAVTFFAEELIVLLRNRQVKDLIAEAADSLLKKVRTNAEKERAGKRFLFNLMFSLISISNVSNESIAEKIRSELISCLIKLLDPESDSRRKLKMLMENKLQELKSRPEAQQSIEKAVFEIAGKINLTPLIMKYLSEFRDSAVNNPETSKIKSLVEGLMERIVSSFKDNRKQQEAVDNYAREFLSDLIEKKHGEIGKLVRLKLEEFNNETLVSLIEDKAGDDLQVIRINGSVVGGLTGVLLFIATYWLF